MLKSFQSTFILFMRKRLIKISFAMHFLLFYFLFSCSSSPSYSIHQLKSSSLSLSVYLHDENRLSSTMSKTNLDDEAHIVESCCSSAACLVVISISIFYLSLKKPENWKSFSPFLFHMKAEMLWRAKKSENFLPLLVCLAFKNNIE